VSLVYPADATPCHLLMLFPASTRPRLRQPASAVELPPEAAAADGEKDSSSSSPAVAGTATRLSWPLPPHPRSAATGQFQASHNPGSNPSPGNSRPPLLPLAVRPWIPAWMQPLNHPYPWPRLTVASSNTSRAPRQPGPSHQVTHPLLIAITRPPLPSKDFLNSR